MIVLLTAFLLQASSDARFEELKRRTEAIGKMIDESKKPRPKAVNGTIYGAYRVSASKDTMTDATDLSIETKAMGAPSSATMTINCDGGNPDILYYFGRRIVDNDTVRWSIRVDQNPAVSFAGPRTRDLKGVFIEGSSLEFMDKLNLFPEMMVGKQVRIRVTPEVGNDIEHVFSLSGFNQAFRVLPCGA